MALVIAILLAVLVVIMVAAALSPFLELLTIPMALVGFAFGVGWDNKEAIARMIVSIWKVLLSLWKGSFDRKWRRKFLYRMLREWKKLVFAPVIFALILLLLVAAAISFFGWWVIKLPGTESAILSLLVALLGWAYLQLGLTKALRPSARFRRKITKPSAYGPAPVAWAIAVVVLILVSGAGWLLIGRYQLFLPIQAALAVVVLLMAIPLIKKITVFFFV